MPYNQFKFELTYNGTTTEVDEPQGFGEFNSEIKRDFNFGGVFYKYTAEDLKLGFIGTGRTILETAYQNDGIDANVNLTISGRSDKFNPWVQVYTGRAVFENRQYDKNYFLIDFDQVDFLENLTNRINIKVALDRTTDLDGNAVTPPTATEIPFQSKTIRKQNRFEPSEDAILNTPSLTGTLLFAPFDVATVEELETVTTYASGGAYLPSGIATDFKPQQELDKFENDVTIEWDFPLRIKITSTNPGTPSSVNLDYDLYIGHYDTDDVLINTYNVESGTQAVTVNFSQDVQLTLQGTQSFSVSKTDKIRLYYDFTVGGEDALLDLRRDEGYFWKITQDTTTQQSNVKIYTYHEVFKHVVNCISGADFYSDYLGLQEYGYPVDGCAGLNGFTGGYFIRGVNTAPQVSLRQLLDDVRLRWGLGWTVEDVYLSDFRVRVEPLEFFYSDLEVLSLTNIEDYEETVNEDIINEIELGYKKYATQERFEGTIDDWCTEVQFNLPIQRKRNKLELKTDIISSPYIIEFTRRKGAIDEGWKYDEDPFHVDLVRDSSYTFIPRTTEDFTNISGVIGSSNAINLHHHPVYFFLAQALYLNSWTTGKNTLLSKYRNTFFAVNKSLQAEYTGSCNHLETNGLVRTNEDFTIQNVYNGLRLFDLDIIRFKTALTTEQLNTIINDHENVGTNNYGYFSFTDPDDNTKQGYLKTLKWNPVTEIADFELIKRSNNYFTNNTCQDWSGSLVTTRNLTPYTQATDGKWNDDGTKFYTSGIRPTFRLLSEYACSSAYSAANISLTATATQNLLAITGNQNSSGISWNSDGTKLAVSSSTDERISVLTFTVGFDISSYSSVINQTLANPSGANGWSNVHMHPSGTSVFLVGNEDGFIRKYTMSTPYDPTTLSLSQTLDISDIITTGRGIDMNSTGTRFLVCGSSGKVAEFTMSAFDLDTSNFVTCYDAVSARGVAINGNTFTKFYLTNDNTSNDFVSEYNL